MKYVNFPLDSFFNDGVEARTKISVARKGKYTGDLCPSYDGQIYNFRNIKTNETFAGTFYIFTKTYNLNKSSVFDLKYGRCKTLKGWVVETS